MKIAVVGLWHLGCVTAACLAKANYNVIAYDHHSDMIKNLKNNIAPIFEPGLNDLLFKTNHLTFSNDPEDISEANIIWVTYDTPVDDNDIADIDFVTKNIIDLFPHLQNNAIVLISSQLPVGTIRQLQNQYKKNYPHHHVTFACSPENLRLGKAIEVFTHPDRIIVGIDSENETASIQNLLSPFTNNIIWMSIESAEMTKHALNAFLATSVVFINELAILCEKTGANAREVEKGLKSEDRIGPKAYLKPGNAIAGGTLARDVNYLVQIGQNQATKTPLFSALLDSNHIHKQWSCRKVVDVLKDLKNKTITALGLTYKVGTDTLRRSTAVESCLWLNNLGANILAYDPVLTHLPEDLAHKIQLKTTLDEALTGSDAILISTEHPEFQNLTADQIIMQTNQACIFDPGAFLAKKLGVDARLRYFSVGQ